MKQVLLGRCLWDFSVTGEVVIFDDETPLPIEKYANRIIIAHSPSPDIFLYMHQALAIVTETGGVLCHAAVLAMEMGCPIIVGVAGAMQSVKNGMTIGLEGKNGIGTAYEAIIC